LHLVLNGMRQIPVVRGTKDTDALERAMTELRGGSCVGIFPEGTRSLGRKLRARSGVGRLAAAVPEAKIVCAAVTGATDIPRFPKRPRLKVTFLEPRGGQMKPGEDPTELAARITADMRELAPISTAGRRPKAVEAAADEQPRPAQVPDAELLPPAGKPSE
jgi:1-acyl-sn-glycerol-3-phosphate acyltransferase